MSIEQEIVELRDHINKLKGIIEQTNSWLRDARNLVSTNYELTKHIQRIADEAATISKDIAALNYKVDLSVAMLKNISGEKKTPETQ